MKPGTKQLRDLLRLVEATAPEEIDCEEFLVRVGGYLESLGPGAVLSPDLATVGQHLQVCPECKEEFDALLEVFPKPAGG